MADERLYIDGQLVDINEDTKITLNVKSNLFRDVSKISSNSTYTIKLPKTVRNQMLLEHVDLVSGTTGYAYETHSARYFRNGVEVIKDGRATVMQVTNEAIEVAIVWGLYSSFATLLSEGTTLNKLESDARIMFGSDRTPCTYAEAIEGSYFYAYYNVYEPAEEDDLAWTRSASVTYPVMPSSTTSSTSASGGGALATSRSSSGTSTSSTSRSSVATRTATSYASRSSSVSTYGNLHPVVRVPWVLDLIKANTGVDFSFTGTAAEDISTLVIPLINKKSTSLTFDEKYEATLATVTSSSAVDVVQTVTSASNMFPDATGGASVTTLTPVSACKLIIDVAASWQFDNTGCNVIARSTRGGWTYYTYRLNGTIYLKVKVTYNGETTEYYVGWDSSNTTGRGGSMTVTTPGAYQGTIKMDVTGKGTIEVEKGSTIELEWCSTLKDATLLGGTITAQVQTDDEVPVGGYFPIAYNLPAIKVVDFVKFLAAITGTFPLQLVEDGKVEFVPLSTVWDNKANAKDWTRRVIAQAGENKPKNLEFVLDDYAQHNLYQWKEDETVVGSYDGDLTIDNETLEVEQPVMEFPFAASDGYHVPMYEPEFTTDDDGTTTVEYNYSACEPRILRLHEGSTGLAEAYFDIDMQAILDEKYADVKASLQATKIVTEKMRIRDLELLAFDETKPIYLAQYGSYFAVTEIKADSTGLADVTMLQLYFD